MRLWKAPAVPFLAGLAFLSIVAFAPGAQMSGPGGRPLATLHGKVLGIQSRDDGSLMVMVDVYGARTARPATHGGVAHPLAAGMYVRLLCPIGSGIKDMPLGGVVDVAGDGRSCTVEASSSLLDEIADAWPGGLSLRTRDFLCPGAQVTISYTPF